MLTRSTLAALALLTIPVSSNAATIIALTDFDQAVVEDFNAAPLGVAAATDPLFSNLGITSIEGAYYQDRFNTRPNSSRALGVNNNGDLQVIDSNEIGLSASYSLSFANAITKFGFGIHDQRTSLALNFFNNGTIVDTLNLYSNTTDLAQFYVQATSFDQVTISAPKYWQSFALDNLTVEAPTPVPIPAGLPMLVAALGALVWTRRKSIG